MVQQEVRVTAIRDLTRKEADMLGARGRIRLRNQRFPKHCTLDPRYVTPNVPLLCCACAIYVFR
jgi:hypothetical protein